MIITLDKATTMENKVIEHDAKINDIGNNIGLPRTYFCIYDYFLQSFIIYMKIKNKYRRRRNQLYIDDAYLDVKKRA